MADSSITCWRKAQGLAGVGEVHDGIGAAVDGDADLLPLLGCVGLVARDAEVHVDLGGEALAHAARGEAALDMADVGRDGDRAARHALAVCPGSRPSCSATVRICGVILPARAKSICVMGSFGGLPAVLMVLMHSLPSLALSISGSSGRGGRCPLSACRLVLQAPRDMQLSVPIVSPIRAHSTYFALFT